MRDVDAFIDQAWWPLSAIGEAVEAMARAHGITPTQSEGVNWPVDAGNLDNWLEWVGQCMGIEALPIGVTVRELPAFLDHGGPALITLDNQGRRGFLALNGRRRGNPSFLCPDGKRVRAKSGLIAARITHRHFQNLQPEVDRVLTAAGIPAERSSRVAAAMIAERIGGEEISGLTMLRLPASADFLAQFRLAGLPWRLAQIVVLFVLLYGAELWSWSLIGNATLTGRLDWGWFTAWLLLAFTMMPWRVLADWNEAVFSLETGRLVKSRLLAGALALPPDSIKRQGVGALIGKVMESQALEGTALSGGFSVVVGFIELGFALWVLSIGAAPQFHVFLLCAFVLLTAVLGLRYHRRITAWTVSRLGMTNHLVEAMVGHRTRLAQERAERRDRAEDSQLAGYLRIARDMDRTALQFGSVMAVAWLVTGLLALGPALAGPSVPDGALLAISLGGMMLGQRALSAIGDGLSGLSRAGFAWGQVRSIFRAGSVLAKPGVPVTAQVTGGVRSRRVLEARGLSYRYDGANRPVLDGVDIAINAGDRILIEGPSGGGKSTLANILCGLRPADGGLLLLDGLDRHTIGDNWHARVTSAPQFHDNHILSGTLAFNLLMGRQWPPGDADLADAEALCGRLGLSELLRKMPGGLHQQVGETGWQLSHGERSRIFLARALLQRAQVTILDESFASLDPATMDQCLMTALEEAETLIVIAHP